MHHSQTSDTRHCTLRTSLPATDLGMLSLFSIDGYLTPTFALFGSQATSAPRPAFVTPFASRFVPPDPPPPRA
jgi:hypothetical protein